MQNISLSPHFELREFTASSKARKHGMVNEPPPEAVENLRALCVNTLEPLREALGLPIIISSGYRSKALNDLVSHHSEKSQHMSGQAADFWIPGEGDWVKDSPSRRELLVRAFRMIIQDDRIQFDQLIIYPTFIHVSFVSSGKNRRQMTRGYRNGTYAALSRAQALELE